MEKSKKIKRILLPCIAGLVILAIVAVLFGSCNHRRAARQLSEAPVLHAKKTAIYDGNEKEIRLKSKTVTVTSSHSDVSDEIGSILASDDYNSVCLQFSGEMLDITDAWKLGAAAEDILADALSQCTTAQKYLLIDVIDYPEEYNCWYDTTDFRSQVASFWGRMAKSLEGEKYVGAYILSDFPRPGTSENVDSLTFMETFLQSICDSIRQNDELHMICIGVMTPFLEDQDKYHAFPFVEDRNFTYISVPEDLQFYTEQSQTSMDGASHLVYNCDFWHHVGGVDTQDTIRGKSIAFTTTDYQTRESDVFQATGDGWFARVGAYVDPADSNGGGELRVKSLQFVECDQYGQEIKAIYNMDSSVNVPFDCLSAIGEFNEGSVYEEDGTAYLESMYDSTFFYVRDLNIPLEKGKYYKVIITMKQRGMVSGYNCTAAAQLYTCTEYSKLNKELVQKTCDTLFKEAKAVGVPILFADVGASANVTEEKGRSAYLTDLYAAIADLKQGYICS